MVNPIYMKENKLNNRSLKVVVMLVLYNLVLVILGFIFLTTEVDRVRYAGRIEYSSMMEFYILFSAVEISLMVLMAPGLTASAISGERERQTLDLLLATRMRPMSILIGKMTSSLEMIICLVISNLPIIAMVFVFGGLRIVELFLMQATLAFLAITIGSAGMFFSSICEKTSTATVASYAYTAFMTLGTYVVCLAARLFEYNDSIYSFIWNHVGYILLMNPIMSYYILLNEQIGDTNAVLNVLNYFGTYEKNYVTSNWFMISMILQGVFALILLVVSAINIEPVHRKKFWS